MYRILIIEHLCTVLQALAQWETLAGSSCKYFVFTESQVTHLIQIPTFSHNHNSGGVISQLLNWRWIFWIMSMVIIPLAFIAFFLAPAGIGSEQVTEHEIQHGQKKNWVAKLRDLDWFGLISITRKYSIFLLGFFWLRFRV